MPLVQAGSTEEKAEIGARVRWSGVGVRIRATRPSPRRLRAAVREVLHEPAYAAAAARMGVELRQHDAAQEAAVLVERLADTGEPVTRTVAPARAR